MAEGAVQAALGEPHLGARQEEAARLLDFEAFYLRYRDQVRRTAYSVGGGEDLDDIVQESFVRIWKGWASFRGDSDPKTWVYRITINAARDHWRKKGRFKNFLKRFFAEPRSESLAPEQENWGLGRALAKALDSLSRPQREAVTLCYLEGIQISEAAEICGLPEGTLKSRLHQARKYLAEALQNGGEDE
jgi:RNA polymerase sigma-70 factor (ECF subfamily)